MIDATSKNHHIIIYHGTMYSIILTDNGSEFAKYIKEQGAIHYHTDPKTPKQNARCERVNRTIQDEFMIKYENLLFDDINLFNKKLTDLDMIILQYVFGAYSATKTQATL